MQMLVWGRSSCRSFVTKAKECVHRHSTYLYTILLSSYSRAKSHIHTLQVPEVVYFSNCRSRCKADFEGFWVRIPYKSLGIGQVRSYCWSDWPSSVFFPKVPITCNNSESFFCSASYASTLGKIPDRHLIVSRWLMPSMVIKFISFATAYRCAYHSVTFASVS